MRLDSLIVREGIKRHRNSNPLASVVGLRQLPTAVEAEKQCDSSIEAPIAQVAVSSF